MWLLKKLKKGSFIPIRLATKTPSRKCDFCSTMLFCKTDFMIEVWNIFVIVNLKQMIREKVGIWGNNQSGKNKLQFSARLAEDKQVSYNHNVSVQYVTSKSGCRGILVHFVIYLKKLM